MSTLKRVLALSLALMMAMSIGVFAKFDDVEEFDASCVDAIEMLSALEIINGYTDGTFGPDKTITRAEAAKMIYVLCNGGNDDGANAYAGLGLFSDTQWHWAENYINYCASVGIIAGRAPTIFDPSTPVTGYELAKMLLVVANYNPDVQGYVGDKWKTNVLRDCNLSGLTDGYDYQMDQAAPRQWAAKMFSTLILDVEVAQYIGDLLVTGSGLDVKGAKTVGVARLKLVTFEGELTQTLGLNIGGGADEYDFSVVQREDGNNTVGTEINYDVDKALLGQMVTVVAKAANTSLTGTSLYGTKNLTILNVAANGKSEVYNTTLTAITYDSTDKLIDFSGYNGGNEKSFTGTVYGNDYTAVNTATTLGYKGDDAVTAVDTDGDGKLEYVFVTLVDYAKVTAISSNRIVAEAFSANTSDVNYVGNDPVRGDVIAITENYESGDCVYDIRVIEGTEGLKVNRWTGLDTAIDSLTLDGTKYNVAHGSIGKVKRNHSIYYFDGKTLVYSQATTADTSVLDSTVAIVTAISHDGGDQEEPSPRTDATGTDLSTYGFRVQYMGIDGKISSAKWYKHDNDSSAVGGVITSYSAANKGHVTAIYNAVGALQDVKGGDNTFGKTNAPGAPVTQNLAFVLVEENSDGTVTFYEYDESNVVNIPGLGVASAFDDEDGELTFTNGKKVTLYVDSNTKIFARLSDNTFKVVNGDKLYSYSSGYAVTSYVSNKDTGVAQAIYLYSATEDELPGMATSGKYGVVTSSITDAVTYTNGLNGTGTYKYESAINKDGSFELVLPTSENFPARRTVFSYSTGTNYHTVSPIALDVVGSISNVDYDNMYIVINGTRYYYSDSTTMFDVRSGGASVLTAPFPTLGNVDDAAVILKSDGKCDLIILNSAGAAIMPQVHTATIGTTNQPQIGGNAITATNPMIVGKKITVDLTGLTGYDAEIVVGGTVKADNAATAPDYTLAAGDFGKTVVVNYFNAAGKRVATVNLGTVNYKGDITATNISTAVTGTVSLSETLEVSAATVKSLVSAAASDTVTVVWTYQTGGIGSAKALTADAGTDGLEYTIAAPVANNDTITVTVSVANFFGTATFTTIPVA